MKLVVPLGGGRVCWVLSVGRARRPGRGCHPSNRICIECVKVRWRVRPTFWRLLSTDVSQLGLSPFLTCFLSAPSALQFGLLLARTLCLVVMLLWVCKVPSSPSILVVPRISESVSGWGGLLQYFHWLMEVLLIFFCGLLVSGG